VLRNGTKRLYLNPPAATLNIFLEWSEESGPSSIANAADFPPTPPLQSHVGVAILDTKTLSSRIYDFFQAGACKLSMVEA
jgi:hypothetical protein